MKELPATFSYRLWHNSGLPAFGDGGKYRLVKDDAVNMRYSQEITAGKAEAGIFQGPQNFISGEKYVGSIYAKGKGELIVGLRNANGQFVARKSLGKTGKEWKKYAFTLEPQISCDGDFAIIVKGGTVQVDMATMTTHLPTLARRRLCGTVRLEVGHRSTGEP